MFTWGSYKQWNSSSNIFINNNSTWVLSPISFTILTLLMGVVFQLPVIVFVLANFYPAISISSCSESV